MKPWKTALISMMALIMLTGCGGDGDGTNNGSIGRQTVSIVALERGSLHYWRVRALTENTSGPWSDPSFFRLVNSADALAGSLERSTVHTGAATQRSISAIDEADSQLAKTDVTFEGLYEDTVPPMPTWRAVDSAKGFELEIVNTVTASRKASILLDEQSVCNLTDCATLLVEIDAGDNVPPSAAIRQLETDPAQPDLLRFTAEDSIDSDGVISLYRWRIDGRYIGTPTSADFEYRFTETGSFKVGVEVTDDVGIVDLTFLEVQVDSAGRTTVITTSGGQDTNISQGSDSQNPVLIGVNLPGNSGDLLQSGALQPVTTSPLSTGTLESWQLRGTANTVLAAGNTVFVGGLFTEIYNQTGDSLPRANLAALNRYTGLPTDFAPALNGEVWALELSPDRQTLYVGGEFLTAEGLPRPRIAAYDVQTGLLKSFAISAPDRPVRAISAIEDRVYLGGVFTRIGNVNKRYLAAFNSVTGELDEGFTASADAIVVALAAQQGQLWIGGDFNRINNNPQRGVGAVDIVTGAHIPTASVDYRVIDVVATDTQVFVAGGGSGGRATAIELASGVVQWEISGDGNFQTADVDLGRFVYFGGHYESIEGDGTIDRLTRHDKATGMTDTSWLPSVNGIRSVNALDVTADGVYIAGDFTRVQNSAREGLAIFKGRTE